MAKIRSYPSLALSGAIITWCCSTSAPAADLAFDSMTCERLQAERSRRMKIYSDLRHPALFSSTSAAQREKDLPRVVSEIKIIEKVQVDKKCRGANSNWSSHMEF
jgi:hypothetical protein